MSTGGCGDVLTGLIAGMTAMGLDAFEAACLSVYVHGKAGDYAASGKRQGRNDGSRCIRSNCICSEKINDN